MSQRLRGVKASTGPTNRPPRVPVTARKSRGSLRCRRQQWTGRATGSYLSAMLATTLIECLNRAHHLEVKQVPAPPCCSVERPAQTTAFDGTQEVRSEGGKTRGLEKVPRTRMSPSVLTLLPRRRSPASGFSWIRARHQISQASEQCLRGFAAPSAAKSMPSLCTSMTVFFGVW